MNLRFATIGLAMLMGGALSHRTYAEPTSLPAGATVKRNVAYGPDPLERMDVYIPAHAKDTPVLFMVHGGGWRRGDKAHAGVVDNKVAHWLPEGFIFISTNYQLIPKANPLE